jgi:formate-dependent nitrite reductase membrane component NrfD
MVPDARFESYYGRPVLKAPTWKALNIAGYFFLGGVAGAGSVMAAGAHFTGRPALARANKTASMVAVGLSMGALVHDLGRPSRFVNMLRTFKPTSPMSVGSWLLTVYGPAAAVAALSDLTGIAPAVGTAATLTAAATGPVVASYTAALLADTAVPAWHDGYRYLPFLFVSSAASAAAGAALLGAPVLETGPARRLAVLGGTAEMVTSELLRARMGIAGEAFGAGKAKRYHQASLTLTATGIATVALAGRRSRVASALAGTALLAGSALARFGIFEAGRISAADPKYTVGPQRRRLDSRRPAGPPAD